MRVRSRRCIALLAGQVAVDRRMRMAGHLTQSAAEVLATARLPRLAGEGGDPILANAPATLATLPHYPQQG